MSSEVIVILVIVVFAVAGLFYLEWNSRKNRKDSDE
jgi:flagellar basal body-associated protein FliL